MSGRERRRSRALQAYFQPRLLDRLHRRLFDSRRPGRPSPGDVAIDRLDELLVMAGIRLLILSLFVDLVTGEVLALTAFNVALGLPVLAIWLRRRWDPGHTMERRSLWRRLLGWRRRRRVRNESGRL